MNWRKYFLLNCHIDCNEMSCKIYCGF